jgi:hypothetical protein
MALDCRHFQARSNHHARFICRLVTSCFVEGVKQVLHVEGLRRLDPEQPLAIHGALECRPALREGVGEGEHGHGAVVALQCVE